MMKENSPIGVTAMPVRSASFAGVPTSVRAPVIATVRATRVNAATLTISPNEPASSCRLICMPMATKNTALNTSRMPSNVRSTCVRCGVSATIVPSKNAPSASE